MLLNAAICVLGYSCTKNVLVKPAAKESSFPLSSVQKLPAAASDINIELVNLSELGKDVQFNATKTVSLSTSLGISVGTLTIKRGSDRLIYFNYLLNAGWSFIDLDLTAWPVNNPSLNILGDDIGKAHFRACLKHVNPVSEYSFVLKNLQGEAFSVSSGANIIYTYHGQAIYQARASAGGLFK